MHQQHHILPRHRSLDDNLEVTHSYTFDQKEGLDPSSADYTALFNEITTTTLIKGGTQLFDKSALYHIQGGYNFDVGNGKVNVGGNYRLYAPNSRGNIF